MSLLIRNARVLSMGKARPKRGAAMRDLGVIRHADVIIHRDKIVAVGESLSMPAGARTIEANGRVLCPAFVDCHTHACWAGDRLGEWERRLAGESYLALLKSGGGIMSTVRAVREASQEQLMLGLLGRLNLMLACGTMTAEVKSGYGLSTDDELKMLRAIRDADEHWAGTVIPTALLGHALDPEDPGLVERTILEILPAIHEEFPTIAIDAYCEQGAWTLEQTVELMRTAKAMGHPIRVHTDQFNSLGMLKEAITLGALSVDHLEAAESGDLESLAQSQTYAVALPACGFHLDGRYTPLREYVDAGGLACIATNYNPGSAPCASMPLVIAMAVRQCGLTPAEAIVAATVNPAAMLGLSDRGAIQPGQRADLLLLRGKDERELAYEFGTPGIRLLVCGGEAISPAEVGRPANRQGLG